MESALEDRNPGPQMSRRRSSDSKMRTTASLKTLKTSEILPDSREFTYLSDLLDQWLQLSGTVDTAIASYPVWRGVTELVADLELSNPRLWSNRLQPLLQLLQNPDYAAFVFGNPVFITCQFRPTSHTGSPTMRRTLLRFTHIAAARVPDEVPPT